MSKLENKLSDIIKNISLPTNFDYTKTLHKPLLFLILFLFILLSFLSLPPVIDFLISTPTIGIISFIMAEKNSLERWLPCFIYIIEIIILLFLGGSIFGESVALGVGNRLKKLEVKIDQKAISQMEKIYPEFGQLIEEYKKIIKDVTYKNFIYKAYTGCKLFNRIINYIYSDIPNSYIRLIKAKALIAFPGGFYGLMAFIFVWILSFLKLISTYLEYIN